MKNIFSNIRNNLFSLMFKFEVEFNNFIFLVFIWLMLIECFVELYVYICV